MPYIKVQNKRRFKRHYSSEWLKIAKYAAVILVLAAIAGKTAIVISEMISPSPIAKRSSLADKMKNQVVNNYKEKYGDDWKTKAKEEFGGQMDEATKQELKSKYANELKSMGF